MTLHTPVYVQPVVGDANFPNGIPFTAQELRRNIEAMLSAAGLPVQSGVTPLDGQFAVTQHAAGANFSVDVAAGHAFVPGTDIANQFAYGCWNDGVVNVVTPAPPASGTENHRLVLQVQDRFSNGVWTGYTANLNLLADTGSGTPAQPASSITLALIAIAAGQASVLNANITDQRPILNALLSAYKSANLGRTATALTLDPDLQLTVAPNAVYDVRGNVNYQNSGGTSAFTWNFATPAGAASGGYSAPYNEPGPVTGSWGNTWGLVSQAAASDNLSHGFPVEGTLITGANGGTFGLQWACATASAGTLTVGAGSKLIAQRIR